MNFRWVVTFSLYLVESPVISPKIKISNKILQKQMRKDPTCTRLYPPLLRDRPFKHIPAAFKAVCEIVQSLRLKRQQDRG